MSLTFILSVFIRTVDFMKAFALFTRHSREILIMMAYLVSDWSVIATIVIKLICHCIMIDRHSVVTLQCAEKIIFLVWLKNIRIITEYKCLRFRIIQWLLTFRNLNFVPIAKRSASGQQFCVPFTYEIFICQALQAGSRDSNDDLARELERRASAGWALEREHALSGSTVQLRSKYCYSTEHWHPLLIVTSKIQLGNGWIQWVQWCHNKLK